MGRGGFVHHSQRGWGGDCLVVAALCSGLLLWSVDAASAQCSARQALQSRLKTNKAPPASVPRVRIVSASDVPTWKTIEVGGISDSMALRNALDAANCATGSQVEEVLARPAFTVSARKMEVELVAVSPAELGFDGDHVALAAVYARALQLGFHLAPPEVGPQLRLQYVDQPLGEFLIVAMEPIATWSGEPVILTVANGGAGLILIGQDGSASAQVPLTSRFLFARSQGFDDAHLTARR